MSCISAPSSVSLITSSGASRGAMLATLAMAAMPFAAYAPAAYADENADADARESIVVTGHRLPDENPNANPNAPYKVEKSADGKFTEPLRDTPKTITAIPKEVLKDIGATSFRELVRSTPGVTLGTGEGGNAFGDRIFIRGFEARGDVYIDGLRDPGVTSREVFAVEQIEVVKGPSGSFGGRGTTGGLVSLQSKLPQTGNSFGVLEGGIGTENYYRATADANIALGDHFAIRLNGLYHNADTPGRDYVGSERTGIAAAALWQPTDSLSVMADYYRYRLDGLSDYGHPFDTATQRPYKVDPDNFYGAVGRDFLKNGSDIGTLTVKFEPSDRIALRSTVRYGETYNYYVVSVPRAPRTVATPPGATDLARGFGAGQLVVDTGTPQRHADNNTFAMLTDATIKLDSWGVAHTLVGGVEMAREKVVNRSYLVPATVEDGNGNIVSATGFTRDLFNPNPVLGYRVNLALNSTAIPTRIKVDTMAAYLIDTVKFSPNLIATLGLRYDAFDIHATGAQGAGSFSRKQSMEFLNGQASLLYKPAEPLSLYASFSTSSNPSGEQLDSIGADYGGFASGLESLEPERNKAYEIGAKYELNKTLLLTAALFQIDKKNAREQVSAGVFALAGELRSRGAELGISGNITPRWAVFGGFTWLDATIRKSRNPLNLGMRFPNVPKTSASLLSTYALTDWLSIGGQAYYQSNLRGGQFGGTGVATTAATVPGYWRFDAVARVKPTSNTELRVNVLNLTDKRYYDAIYRSSSPFAYVAPGRSATVTGTIRF